VVSVAEADSVVVAEAPAGDNMAKMNLDELVRQLQQAYGDDLVTVVLYGSAATSDQAGKRPNLNVLVIVKSLGMEQLTREASVARAWADAGNPPPMTLTLDEWQRSADIFPIEYSDILARHKVLAGTPPFGGVAVEKGHLRLQLEYEAMGKLIQLRQGILATGGDSKKMLELLERTLSTFMVIFRSTLRLHGREAPDSKEAVAQEVGSLAGFDPAPFHQAIAHVRGTKPIARQDAYRVLGGYLSCMELLVQHLDAMSA
jgi:hypothetical protein